MESREIRKVTNIRKTVDVICEDEEDDGSNSESDSESEYDEDDPRQNHSAVSPHRLKRERDVLIKALYEHESRPMRCPNPRPPQRNCDGDQCHKTVRTNKISYVVLDNANFLVQNSNQAQTNKIGRIHPNSEGSISKKNISELKQTSSVRSLTPKWTECIKGPVFKRPAKSHLGQQRLNFSGSNIVFKPTEIAAEPKLLGKSMKDALSIHLYGSHMEPCGLQPSPFIKTSPLVSPIKPWRLTHPVIAEPSRLTHSIIAERMLRHP